MSLEGQKTKVESHRDNKNSGKIDDEKRDEIEPVDIEKQANPQYVIPYVKEIMTYLRDNEEKYIPQP